MKFTDTKRDIKLYISSNVKEDENGCWIWQKSLDKRGYGQAWDGKKVIKAHRLSYLAYNGDIDEFIDFKSSRVLMHLCDNPACVNPHHLKQGTQGENMRDAARKGNLSRYKGEDNKNSLLSNSQAIFARGLYRSGAFEQKDLATIYGVNVNVIADLLTRTYGLK